MDVVTVKVEGEDDGPIEAENEAENKLENKTEVAVEITWPDGQRRRYAGLHAGRYWRLEQNTAKGLLLAPSSGSAGGRAGGGAGGTASGTESGAAAGA